MSAPSHTPEQHATNPSQTGQAPAVGRAVALLSFTLLFGMVWSQAEPDPELLAQRNDLIPNVSCTQTAILAAAAKREIRSHEAVKVSESAFVSLDADVNLIGINHSMTIVRDDLTLPLADLLQHIAQLPMGLPAGEYHIVDPSGRTGSLRIRRQSAFQLPAEDMTDRTTHHKEVTLRFISTGHVANLTEAVSR